MWIHCLRLDNNVESFVRLVLSGILNFTARSRTKYTTSKQPSLFVFYGLATSKVISGRTDGDIKTDATLGDQTATTRYPPVSHYPDPELTSQNDQAVSVSNVLSLVSNQYLLVYCEQG